MSKTLLLTAGLWLAGAGLAQAHDYTVGGIRIDHPWARATAPGAPNGAVYLTFENRGGEADRLLGAAAAVSAGAEVHEHAHVDGLMKMRLVEGGLALPRGARLELEPGGLHLMLLGLKVPLAAGETFPLRLTFERAGDVTVEVQVDKPDARPAAHRH